MTTKTSPPPSPAFASVTYTERAGQIERERQQARGCGPAIPSFAHLTPSNSRVRSYQVSTCRTTARQENAISIMHASLVSRPKKGRREQPELGKKRRQESDYARTMRACFSVATDATTDAAAAAAGAVTSEAGERNDVTKTKAVACKRKERRRIAAAQSVSGQSRDRFVVITHVSIQLAYTVVGLKPTVSFHCPCTLPYTCISVQRIVWLCTANVAIILLLCRPGILQGTSSCI